MPTDLPRRDPARAMCRDHDCPSRWDCLRYMATVTWPQTYAEFPRDGDRCGSFIEVKPTPMPAS